MNRHAYEADPRAAEPAWEIAERRFSPAVAGAAGTVLQDLPRAA